MIRNASDVIADRFVLEHVAGSGGMGTVWRASDRATGGAVALKIMQESATVARFEREAATLVEISHPAIVRYVAHGKTPDGASFLAMEWLDGEDLEARLTRGPLATADALVLGHRLAQALGAAHERGIVHRDVKPSNVILVGNEVGAAKLVDFGVARLGSVQALTRPGTVVGTPGYMAPEQARGERDVGPAADVFSLGCVLYECLTGRPAFSAAHVIAILAKVLFDEVPNASDVDPTVSPNVGEAVAQMLAKDPDERPADGRAAAALLSACGTSAGTRRPSVRPALGRKEHRLVSVVVTDDGETAPTMTPDQVEQSSAPSLLRLQLTRLAAGGRVGVLVSEGSATDAARMAVRGALGLRRTAAAIAVATGRAIVSARLPVGEAIDRAVRLYKLAQRTPTPGVRVDEVTAGLLDARFDVEGDSAGLVVRGARATAEPLRTLMGKSTPCVGRDREIATLSGMLDGCIEEPAAAVAIVTAPAGAGKSRLAYEWLTGVRARRRDVQVWQAAGDPLGASSPFALVGQMLRDAAGVRLGEPLEQARAKLRARVARHVEENQQRVTEFLGEVCGVAFPDEGSDLLRNARLDGARLGDQMLLAWLDFVEAEVNAQPLVMVLEDLHWGDAPTVRFVDAALRILRERPLMVLVLARPEVTAVFPGLFAERNPHAFSLAGLGRRAAEKLVRGVLGDGADERVVARIVEQAGGSALLLEELVRAEAEGRGAETPGTVLAILQARLDALPEDARRVLRAASVFGTSFWTGGVVRLLGGASVDQVSTALQLLSSKEVVSPRPRSRFAGEQEHAFRHALFREAAYGTLVDADRELGHRLAGDWLERASERDSAAIAEHFEKGKELGRAFGWWCRAAADALAGNDCEAAVARADRAIACGAEDEALGDLRLLQARAHFWLGQTEEELSRAQAALALIPEGRTAWFDAAGEMASACQRAGDTEKAASVGAALMATDPDGPEADAARGANAARLATVVDLAGRRQLAADLRAITAAAVERHPRDLVLFARMQHALITSAKFHGALASALRASLAQRDAWSRVGDLKQIAGAETNLGDVWMHLGCYAEAEEVLRGVLSSGERLGLRVVTALARHNLGFTLARQGRLVEARTACDAALRGFDEAGVRTGVQVARVYLADVLRRLGDLDAAEREARLAVGGAPSRSRRARASAVLSRVLLDRGDAGGALAESSAGMEILRDVGVEEGEQQLRLVHIEALRATNAPALADAELREALQILADRAASIDDPDLRRNFVENIEEHARLMAFMVSS